MTRRWPSPLSRSQIDRAGEVLRAYVQIEDDEEAENAVEEAGAAITNASAWRQTFAYPLSLVTPGLRNWVAQETSQVVVGQRLKRMPQIVSKLLRFDTMRLSQMEDIAGCRAVLASDAEVEAVARRIERKWKVRYRSDYRQRGKPSTGYRALHFVVVRRDRLVEIQLRTVRQHAWAEAVERIASRTGFDLKDGDGPADLIEYLRLASDLTWAQERRLEVSAEVVERFEDCREKVRPYLVQERPT